MISDVPESGVIKHYFPRQIFRGSPLTYESRVKKYECGYFDIVKLDRPEEFVDNRVPFKVTNEPGAIDPAKDQF